MKFVDQYFEPFLLTVVVLGICAIVGLAAYGLWYDDVHRCHDTNTYEWQTYCQSVYGNPSSVSCTQRYVPVVVCDKP